MEPWLLEVTSLAFLHVADAVLLGHDMIFKVAKHLRFSVELLLNEAINACKELTI